MKIIDVEVQKEKLEAEMLEQIKAMSEHEIVLFCEELRNTGYFSIFKDFSEKIRDVINQKFFAEKRS